ncbi:hypothetical protein BD410DRAFT_810361, partial [Rickenella mellea]
MGKAKKSTSKKRGNPGNFSGEHLKFLVERQATYLEAQKNGKKALATFWENLMADWWTEFPASETIISDSEHEEKMSEAEDDDGNDAAGTNAPTKPVKPSKKKKKTKKQK